MSDLVRATPCSRTWPTAEVFELRGLAKDRKKDFPGAIDDYTQALAQHPDQPGLRNRRGWATSSPMRLNGPWQASSVRPARRVRRRDA